MRCHRHSSMINKASFKHCSLTPKVASNLSQGKSFLSLLNVKFFHRLTTCQMSLILIYNPRFPCSWRDFNVRRLMWYSNWQIVSNWCGPRHQQQICCHLNVLWYDECHPNVTLWVPLHSIFSQLTSVICIPLNRHGAGAPYNNTD